MIFSGNQNRFRDDKEMKRALQTDIARLESLAFRMKDRCGLLLHEFHQRRKAINNHPSAELIWGLYDWLLTPYSLWPVDFAGLAKQLLNSLDGTVHEDMFVLLSIIGPVPDEHTQETIGNFEHIMESGNYDHLLKQPEKYKESEYKLKRDQTLKKIWKTIKGRWDVSKLSNSRGVIRRRMSQERNFRDKWQVDWADERSIFNLFFDAMCYRWKLYGMEHDKPLLLKITVNPTPHGTMIVIPRDWSLDLARDLHWNKIGKLHRSRVSARQGPKLSLTRIQKIKEAKQVLKFWAQAGKKNLHGHARYVYVIEQMEKHKDTDSSWVDENLKLARRSV